LAETADLFEIFLEAFNDCGIFLLDHTGHVLTWNGACEAVNGYIRHEILGRHFSIFYPPEDRKAGKPGQSLRRATAKGRFEDQGWRVRKDGLRFWADVVLTALKDKAGKVIGFAKVIRDTTLRRQALEELRQSEAYLAESQRLNHTASWAWNVSSGDLFWSPEHFRIFGLDPKKVKP